MASFIVRVELHNAKSEDYEKLHERMKAHGFSRTITSSCHTPATYDLPTAEYNFSAHLTPIQVRDKANAVANEVSQSHGVLVTQSAGRAWIGLMKAG